MAAKRQQGQGSAVSPALDEMVCDLIGFMLDELAEGADPGVLACVEDDEGNRLEIALTEDGEEACIEAAQAFVASGGADRTEDALEHPSRYAIGYVGGVELEDGFADAVLVSFYERGLTSEDGMPAGYSAYVLFEGAGEHDGFAWSDPLPAGEEPPLF